MLCALTLLIVQAFCAPRIAAFRVPKFNAQNSLSRSISVVGRQNVPFRKNIPIPVCKLVTEDKELSGVEAIGNESKLDSDWNKFAIAGVVSFL
jgi:hypothetical protein